MQTVSELSKNLVAIQNLELLKYYLKYICF